MAASIQYGKLVILPALNFQELFCDILMTYIAFESSDTEL
jgi:hypothetical protein